MANKLKLTPMQAQQESLKQWLVNNYVNIASNLFKWNNVDKNFGEQTTSEFIERGFIFRGSNVCFKDDKVGLLCLPASAHSNLNVLGIPQKYTAIGFNGQTWNRDSSNAVLMKNNGTYSPDLPMIDYYCERMADCEMAMKVNLNTNKMPFALDGDPDQLLTMMNTVKQITDNEIAVYRPKAKNKAVISERPELKRVDLGAEWLCDKINDTERDYISKLLTFLGINNIETEKKERLTTGEATANMEHIRGNLALKLKCRQDACKSINEMFNIPKDRELSVEVNEEYILDIQEMLGIEPADKKKVQEEL